MPSLKTSSSVDSIIHNRPRRICPSNFYNFANDASISCASQRCLQLLPQSPLALICGHPHRGYLELSLGHVHSNLRLFPQPGSARSSRLILLWLSLSEVKSIKCVGKGRKFLCLRVARKLISCCLTGREKGSSFHVEMDTKIHFSCLKMTHFYFPLMKRIRKLVLNIQRHGNSFFHYMASRALWTRLLVVIHFSLRTWDAGKFVCVWNGHKNALFVNMEIGNHIVV